MKKCQITHAARYWKWLRRYEARIYALQQVGLRLPMRPMLLHAAKMFQGLGVISLYGHVQRAQLCLSLALFLRTLAIEEERGTRHRCARFRRMQRVAVDTCKSLRVCLWSSRVALSGQLCATCKYHSRRGYAQEVEPCTSCGVRATPTNYDARLNWEPQEPTLH